MKNLVLFNPSVEGGGVEKNLEMIANHFSRRIKSKIFLITYDKTLKINKKINYIKPPIHIKIQNNIISIPEWQNLLCKVAQSPVQSGSVLSTKAEAIVQIGRA